MEAEPEDTENVELFLILFNKVMEKNGRNFNPVMQCRDMAEANLAGICKVFGEQVQTRIKTCEFHFKDQRNKRSKKLESESAEKFKELCDAMLKAVTVSAYDVAKQELDDFIAEDSSREFLNSWVSWWHSRRGFIFRAFTQSSAPQMNQAEVLHASWSHRDRPKLSLLDACQADVRDHLLLEVELKGIHNGSGSSGRGPSFMDHKRKKHEREVQRGKRLGKEMFDDASEGRAIDPTSSHRPPKQRSKKSSANPSGQSAVTATTTQQTQRDLSSTQSTSSATNSQHHLQTQATKSHFPHQSQNTHMHTQAYQHITGISTPTYTSSAQHVQSFSQQSNYNTCFSWNAGMSPNIYDLVVTPKKVQKCLWLWDAIC